MQHINHVCKAEEIGIPTGQVLFSCRAAAARALHRLCCLVTNDYDRETATACPLTLACVMLHQMDVLFKFFKQTSRQRWQP